MNFAEPLIDGHRVLPALLEDIARAQLSVHISVFLFFHDPVGIEVADALIAAQRRGAAVRVLLNVEKTALGDPFSTGEREMMKHDPNVDWDPLDVKPLCERMRKAGIEVVDTNIDYDKKIQGVDEKVASKALQIAESIDIDELHADHRKIVVIDGVVAYCGGANIGAQYLHHEPFDPSKDSKVEGDELKAAGSAEPWWKWHDSLTRFEGPIAQELEAVFAERWVLDGGAAFTPRVGAWPHRQQGLPIVGAKLFTNDPDDRDNEIRELYVRLISEAQRSIFIENPYLYHPSIADALVAAKKARSSLRVDLILPAREWNDNTFAHDAQQYFYARYVEVGIDVAEYQNHFNHLKLAVFDERWSIHGSTNLNYRSLENDKDFEAVVLVDDAPLAMRLLETVRDVDKARSKRFTAEEIERTFAGRLRIKTRDPRTLLLISRRML